MDYIKLFEEFSNGNDIDKIIIKANEYLANDKIVKTVNNVMSTLPKNTVKNLINYIEENGIDIDKLNYYLNKYNIVKRVKTLIDKGYDQNEIIKRLVPVTESVTGILFSIAIISAIVFIAYLVFAFIDGMINNKDFEDYVSKVFVSIILVLVVIGIVGGIISIFVQQPSEEDIIINNIEKTIIINKDNQQDTLVIRQNEDGSYYLEKIKN